MIYFIPFVIKMVVEKFNNLDTNQVNAIVSSIDPNEIKKFVVRWDKIKIKLESWKKIKLKWVDTKAFQERSDRKVSKDVNLQQIITVMNSQWTKVNPEQLMKAWEFSDLKQLLDEYRRVLEQYEAKFGTLKSDVNTNLNTSSGNGITGNPQTYNAKTWFFDNAPVVVNNSSATPNNNTSALASNNTVQNNSINAPSIMNNTVNSAANANNATSNNDVVLNWDSVSSDNPYANKEWSVWKNNEVKNTANGVIQDTSKEQLENRVENARVGYSAENIYKSTSYQKDIEWDISRGKQRAILTKWVKWKEDNYNDIIGSRKWDAKLNRPSNQEVALMREYFKKPFQRLSINQDSMFTVDLDTPLDMFHVWDMLVKAYDTGSIKWGIWSEKMNESYRWKEENMPDSVKTSKSESDKKVFKEEMAKLSALYVSFMKKWDGLGGSYTESLIHMINDTARAQWWAWLSSAEGRKWSANYIQNMNNNSGEVELAYPLLHKASQDRQAYESMITMLGGKESNKKLMDLLQSNKISSTTLRSLFNDAMATSKWAENVWNKYTDPWATELYESIVNNKLTWDAATLIAEGIAFGSSPVDTYNTKNIAMNAQVDTARFPNITDGYRFAYFLADVDGKWTIDRNDHHQHSGAQLMAAFRGAVEHIKALQTHGDEKVAQEQVSRNMLNYIKTNAGHKWDHYIANIIDNYDKKSVMDLIKDHPGLVSYMREAFVTLQSWTWLDDVMSGWSMKWNEQLKQSAKAKSVDEFVKRFPEAEQAEVRKNLETTADNLYTQYQKELSTLSESERSYYDGITRESIEQHVANTVSAWLTTDQYGMGVGVVIDITKNLHINLSLAAGPGGVIPGIGMSVDSKIGKNGFVGANINILVPWASVYGWATWEWSRAKLANTLQARWVKTHTIWAGASINILGYGWNIWYGVDSNKVEGIKETYRSLKQESAKFMPALMMNSVLSKSLISTMDIVKNPNYLSQPNNVTTLENNKKAAISVIADELRRHYPSSSDKEKEAIRVSAENIYTGMINTQFDGTPESVNNVVDFFAEQWREQHINELKGKVKLTWFSVWLHAFMIWNTIPLILPVGFKFSKYNQWYAHNDTINSLLAIQNAQEIWTNNKDMSSLSPQAQADYINGVLKSHRLWSKNDTVKAYPQVTVDGTFLRVPYDLYHNNTLNIKIDPSMKGQIAEEKWDILIPSHVSKRISNNTRSQWVEYVLDIWNSTTRRDALHIVRGTEHLVTGNSEYFVDRKNIKGMTETIMELGDKKPIIDALSQLTKKKVTDVTVQWSSLMIIIDGKEQLVSTQGWVIEWVTVTLENSKLKFVSSTGEVIDSEVKRKQLEYTKTLSDEVVAKVDNSANELLERFETQSGFKKFLHAVMDRDYVAALTEIKKDQTMKSWAEWLNPYQEKELVAYLMSAFALENKDYKNKTPSQIMKQRDADSKKYWLNEAFLRWDKAKKWVKVNEFMDRKLFDVYANSVDRPGIKTDKKANLIWYTAFYRKNAKWSERGYAMTLPGRVSTIDNKVYDFPTVDQADKAKQWMVEMIQQDPFAKETIMKALQDKLPSHLQDKVTLDNVADIIAGKSTDPTLQIKLTPKFYLLAECANESIGLEIEKIIVNDGAQTQEVSVNMTEKVKRWPFYSNSTWSQAAATIWNSNIWITVAGGVKIGGNGGWWSDWKVKTDPNNGWWDWNNTGSWPINNGWDEWGGGTGNN